VNGSSAYVYDGAGQRVRKIVGENLRFIYGLGGEEIAEFDGGTGVLKKEYIYGASGLVATIEPTAVNSNGTRYTTSDTLGSPRVITNSSAAVVSRHDYMPFGEEIGAGIGGRTSGMGFGVTDGQRQKFTQKERDIETGLDYFGARYVASSQGRFTTADPVSFSTSRMYEPQAINLYAYCGNDPLTRIDPDGRYYLGTNGKKVHVSVDGAGNVHVGKNANSSLRRYAKLVNQARSGDAISAMLNVANNDTKVHFRLSPDLQKTDDGGILFGLHQAHDKKGKPLDWNAGTGTFNGDAAFITTQNGATEYKEATITIYEGSIKSELSYLQQKYNDPNLTSSEAIVTVGTHEETHDTDKSSIESIKQAQEKNKANPIDVEAPATNVELKTAEEIKKKRKPE